MSTLGFNPNEAWSCPPTKGWECPKCGKCWSPTVAECISCNHQAGNGTIRPKENADGH